MLTRIQGSTPLNSVYSNKAKSQKTPAFRMITLHCDDLEKAPQLVNMVNSLTYNLCSFCKVVNAKFKIGDGKQDAVITYGQAFNRIVKDWFNKAIKGNLDYNIPGITVNIDP